MKKRIVAIAALSLIMISGVLISVWWNGPAVVRPIAQPQQGVQGVEVAFQDFASPTFKTRLTTLYTLKTRNENPVGTLYGQYLFANKSPQKSDQIAITVGQLAPGNTVEDVSAVKMRSITPSEYSRTTFAGAPKDAVVFSKTSEYELGIFWQNGSDYAMVVVSGSIASKADLETSLQAIMQNWLWL